MVTLVSFIVSIVVSILSWLASLMITSTISLADFILIWQLFMIMMWLLNRMAKGTGSHGSINTNDGVDNK